MSTRNASTPSALSGELVTRPDPRAMRMRWFANGLSMAGGVALIVFAVVIRPADPGLLWGLLIGGAFLVGVVAIAWRWQRQAWLVDEPVLVVRADGMRLAHLGEHVWVPWTDVADIGIATPGSGLARTPMLVFALRDDARTVLPDRPVPLGDRMFRWQAGRLSYAQPHEQPPFEVVARTVHERWSAATRRTGDPS
ncbi:MAG: hypothetical protein ACRCY8_09295 [Dermatophilaceae bacterium]